MNTRTLVVVCGALAAVVALTTGTGGFTSATADRGVEVSVANDANALLGVERTTAGTGNGTTNLTVNVTNRFGTSELDTVTVRVDGESTDLAETGPLTPGARGSATVTAVDCGSTIRVDASGDGVDVTLTRRVPCQ